MPHHTAIHMNNKLFLFMLILLALLLFAGSLFILGWKASLLPHVQPTPVPIRTTTILHSPPPLPLNQPKMSLTLEPAEATFHTGQSFLATVFIDTETQTSGVDLFLRFDPENMQLDDMTPGSFFSNPMIISKMKRLDDKAIFYSLASTTKATGKGTLAKLTFLAKNATQNATISIDPRTLIAIKGAIGINLPSQIVGTYTILK